jgi:hypothetical protein
MRDICKLKTRLYDGRERPLLTKGGNMNKYLPRYSSYRKNLKLFKLLIWLLIALNKLLYIWVQIILITPG